jgi:hypothetical protein
MTKGWLFDVYPDYDKDVIVAWLKTDNGMERFVQPFRPSFFVQGEMKELEALRSRLEILSSISDMRFVRRKVVLGSNERTKVLCVTMRKYNELRNTTWTWSCPRGTSSRNLSFPSLGSKHPMHENSG